MPEYRTPYYWSEKAWNVFLAHHDRGETTSDSALALATFLKEKGKFDEYQIYLFYERLVGWGWARLPASRLAGELLYHLPLPATQRGEPQAVIEADAQSVDEP
jgi:hypothetical protein